MSDKPILFSAPMVRALLAGTKTQTRRALKPQPNILNGGKPLNDGYGSYSVAGNAWKRYPIKVGDRLYVREHWRTESKAYDDLAPNDMDADYPVIYEADADWSLNKTVGRSRQGMHMPRWASRITLTVTDVRVQRLQEISEEDALAEGFFLDQRERDANAELMESELLPHIAAIGGGKKYPLTVMDKFLLYWTRMNGLERWDGPAAYDNNPWVAAYTFTVAIGNIDDLARAA